MQTISFVNIGGKRFLHANADTFWSRSCFSHVGWHKKLNTDSWSEIRPELTANIGGIINGQHLSPGGIAVGYCNKPQQASDDNGVNIVMCERDYADDILLPMLLVPCCHVLPVISKRCVEQAHFWWVYPNLIRPVFAGAIMVAPIITSNGWNQKLNFRRQQTVYVYELKTEVRDR